MTFILNKLEKVTEAVGFFTIVLEYVTKKNENE